MRAAFDGDPSAVVALLDQGADPNARCNPEGTTAVLGRLERRHRLAGRMSGRGDLLELAEAWRR